MGQPCEQPQEMNDLYKLTEDNAHHFLKLLCREGWPCEAVLANEPEGEASAFLVKGTAAAYISLLSASNINFKWNISNHE